MFPISNPEPPLAQPEAVPSPPVPVPWEQSLTPPAVPSCQELILLPSFASDVSHQKTDWNSIHSRICHLLLPVLRPQSCFHSEKDRKQGKEQLLRKQVGAGGTSTTPKCPCHGRRQNELSLRLPSTKPVWDSVQKRPLESKEKLCRLMITREKNLLPKACLGFAAF
uniref:Uncharacterized protein n=1 Tax=Serinus canaria TaxID=9135 RepID=A0A8C9MIU8_SERCA